ncbi:MAG TPA: fumarylacetoacetate hydrolase family protein [Ktedonobacteraceae bacterium]|nr:fumarylacetoacetate hydrolase family protein [Ktedonobacteraceae bacterium]
MKLASFSTSAIPQIRLGLVQEQEVVDVDLAARALNLHPYEQMLDLLEHQDEGMPMLRAILEKAQGRLFSEVRTFANIGAVHALTHVQLAAPIPRPRKNILCLGRNYHDHAVESYQMRGEERPAGDAPVFFTKATTTINAPYGQIIIDPTVSEEIDWEVELAVIIGKAGKNIPETEALSYIFGYTALNDVTARDLQDKYKQFFKGKSLDGYCPLGPWIVTADELPDPQQLTVRLRVNGVTKQEGSTRDMIYPVKTIISILSQGMTLEPGDIIATGTPSGIGRARNPPEFLKAGDVMETEIDSIGLLRNEVMNASV